MRPGVEPATPNAFSADGVDRAMPRYFEDLEAGETVDCGTIAVEGDEMRTFADRFDPQPIHTDEAAAAESVYGGLIASGWFTASLVARRLVLAFMNDLASVGGRGIDELRWHTPVRAGDVLSVEVEVLETAPAGNPGLGDYRAAVTATRVDDDEVVLTMEALGVIERREPETTA